MAACDACGAGPPSRTPASCLTSAPLRTADLPSAHPLRCGQRPHLALLAVGRERQLRLAVMPVVGAPKMCVAEMPVVGGRGLCVAVMVVVGSQELRLSVMPVVGRHPLAPLLRNVGERIRINDEKR